MISYRVKRQQDPVKWGGSTGSCRRRILYTSDSQNRNSFHEFVPVQLRVKTPKLDFQMFILDYSVLLYHCKSIMCNGVYIYIYTLHLTPGRLDLTGGNSPWKPRVKRHWMSRAGKSKILEIIRCPENRQKSLNQKLPDPFTRWCFILDDDKSILKKLVVGKPTRKKWWLDFQGPYKFWIRLSRWNYLLQDLFLESWLTHIKLSLRTRQRIKKVDTEIWICIFSFVFQVAQNDGSIHSDKQKPTRSM